MVPPVARPCGHRPHRGRHQPAGGRGASRPHDRPQTCCQPPGTAQYRQRGLDPACSAVLARRPCHVSRVARSIGSAAAPVWCNPRRREEAERPLVPSARPAPDGCKSGGHQPTDTSRRNRRMCLAPALPMDPVTERTSPGRKGREFLGSLLTSQSYQRQSSAAGGKNTRLVPVPRSSKHTQSPRPPATQG